jgi:hypothetical protein
MASTPTPKSDQLENASADAVFADLVYVVQCSFEIQIALLEAAVDLGKAPAFGPAPRQCRADGAHLVIPAPLADDDERCLFA